MSSDFTIRRTFFAEPVIPTVVVAIPAQNEAEQIAHCLRALGAQRAPAGARPVDPIGIVLLVNNSTDNSVEIATAVAKSEGLTLRLYDVTMAPHACNAGGARRAAMGLAADWLAEVRSRDGLIMTTDADSVPAPDWISRARSAVLRGVDGVAGTIELYAQDASALPSHVQWRGALEAEYEALLTELFSRLDPRRHDPWPRHSTEAGANLGVTLRAYRAIGGLPQLACGEDRALVSSLERHGFRVRHDPTLRVSTSGRLEGRAEGGVADTIRLRCQDPDAACDAYLEPAWNAYFRAFWRGRLRSIFTRQGAEAALDNTGFEIDGQMIEAVSFETFWASLEAHDPRLERKLLRPTDLPNEISAATVILRRLRQPRVSSVPEHPVGNPRFVPAE